jgi:hypothetical protein
MTIRIDPHDIGEVIRKLAVFEGLAEQATDALIQGGAPVEYQNGEFLIRQGDPSNFALILIVGAADVLVETTYGTANLASLEAPALVGEIGVFTNAGRTASIQAKTPIRAIRLGREELHEFLDDPAPDAYEQLVDRLLASPHFGERWGRHWLDLARYADTDGYEDDKFRPDAWRYREWVIGAINRDLPFDQFTLFQLAGDLLPDSGYEEKVATGFHRMTLSNNAGAGGIKAEMLMVWGRQDPHVPLEGRKKIHDALCESGVSFTWHEFNAQHAFLRDEGFRYDPALARIGYGLALELFHRKLR